jgi:hypothetical protein
MERFFKGKEHFFKGKEHFFKGKEHFFKGMERFFKGKEHFFKGKWSILYTSERILLKMPKNAKKRRRAAVRLGGFVCETEGNVPTVAAL